MIDVIADTSFLIHLATHRIKNIDSIETEIGTLSYVVPKIVRRELEHLTNDSDNMIYGATSTDPIYYIESNSSGASTLFVKPTPTANQPAKVYHISYPTVTYSQNIIANFPDEAEHLVVLYAAIKATEYMMLSEEDQEVYAPQLATLKQDYAQGLAALKGGQ